MELKIRKVQFDMDFSQLGQFKPYDYNTKATIPDWFYPKEAFFIRHLLWRRYNNMNTILLIVGGVRTGKSYTGLKLAETYCKAIKKIFNVLDQCSFDIIPFLLWSEKETDNVFVLDEVGVNLNPSEWFTVQAKIFRNFTQTQGFRRNVMILVLPNISFLLKSVRFMCNYVIETKFQGSGFVRKIMIDHSKGRGFLQNLGGIKVSLPTKYTLERYEKMKKEWNDTHLREDIETLKDIEDRKYYKNTENNGVIPPFTQKMPDWAISPSISDERKAEILKMVEDGRI